MHRVDVKRVIGSHSVDRLITDAQRLRQQLAMLDAAMERMLQRKWHAGRDTRDTERERESTRWRRCWATARRRARRSAACAAGSSGCGCVRRRACRPRGPQCGSAVRCVARTRSPSSAVQSRRSARRRTARGAQKHFTSRRSRSSDSFSLNHITEDGVQCSAFERTVSWNVLSSSRFRG